MLQWMAPESFIAHIGLSGERESTKLEELERWKQIWEKESREELGRRTEVNMVKMHNMKFLKNYQKYHVF